MRLRRLDLTRYGRFTDFSLDFGEREAGRPDLHVVYGPNEAGKTTAFSAFLDLLFGIEARSRYNFLHPYDAMRIGAALEWDGDTRELVRVKRNKNSLLGAGGQAIGEALIGAALGGLGRDAYRTMFSLDDDTLEKGGDSILQSQGDLGEILFSASSGLADLSRTLDALQSEADNFYRFRARSGELIEFKQRLAELKAERDSIDTLAGAYAQLVAERDAARARYDELAAERADARSRAEGLRALLKAHPLWLRLQNLRRELTSGEDIPAAPAHWPDELAMLSREEVELQTRREALTAAIDRLDAEIGALTPDRAALDLGERFKRLGELAHRFITAADDLPRRRSLLKEVDAAIERILADLARPTADDPRELLLPVALSVRLRELGERRALVAQKRESLEREAQTAAEELAAAREKLAGLGGAEAEPTALKAALDAWRQGGFYAARRLAERALDSARATLDERLAQLAPWSGAAEALQAMALPSPARMESWRAALKAAEGGLSRRLEAVERLESEEIRRERELLRERLAVDEGAADAARADRERLWQEHRQKLDATSAERFAAALAEHDRQNALLLAHAAELAQSRELRRALVEAREDLSRAHAKAEAAREALQALHAEIDAGFAQALGVSAPGWHLADWEAWANRRQAALDVWRTMRDAEREAREAVATEEQAKARLAETLAAAGRPAEGPAEALAAAAEELLAREAEIRAARSEVERRDREAAARAAQLAAAVREEEEWRAEWEAAGRESWIGAEATPAQARAVLDALARLAPEIEKRASLADRIGKMEADQTAFRREVEIVSLALGIGGEGDAMARFEAIGARVRAAENAEEARRRKEKERRSAADDLVTLEERIALHTRRAAEMTRFFGVGSLGEVAEKLRQAEARERLKTEASTLARDITAALGKADLCECEALLNDADAEALGRELGELEARAESEEARARELWTQYSKASDRVEAVGGDDAVARIEEKRRTVLLEIEERALHHLRLRIGIVAAERALRAYRERHRSSMMERASEAFRTISRGAYQRLGTQPERDAEVLVGIAADGGSKLAPDMSKGTRFQLYLALRVAGYFEFAKMRPPVPFVSDDIMETFDDFRAEEAFRLFAQMAEVGQVIYLTHHRHLCDIARSVAPGVAVHELPGPG
ncbi:MAG TPA: AAA family ATPase [Mesorhizobium sp.]|jgi:uncharacterized protein YhaN|nr:AAA family ATPase [Mesorhizobium sp.]